MHNRLTPGFFRIVRQEEGATKSPFFSRFHFSEKGKKGRRHVDLWGSDEGS